jgi:peptidoglycan/xylan/chitin deacetylase (PgdA/CDA1 family)
MMQALKRIVRSAGLRRNDVAAARMYCERHALATVGRRRARGGGRILCYHSVGQPEFGVNDVTPALFRRQLELALDAGYRFVYASEIARTGGRPTDLAVTFDDGLKSVLTGAAPVLRQYKIPFSIFVVSEWAEHIYPWQEEGVLGWRDLTRLMEDGAEIGSHSATHRDFGEIDIARMRTELGGSRQTIEQRLGISATTFAIPLGQSRNWSPIAAVAAREAGYDIVYAQAEETRPSGTIARTFVTHYDNDRIFKALLGGAYDRWEEWV